MTEETDTAESSGTDEAADEPNTSKPNIATESGDDLFSASRRDVLRGSAALAFSPLLGNVTGVRDVDLDAVTWTAQNRTVKGREVMSQKVTTSNPNEWYVAHATNTQLQYLGAQWEAFGNPNSNPAGDGDWHLRHTFALTSYSLALRPWVLRWEENLDFAERMDWVPAVEMGNLPEHVNKYLKQKYGHPGLSSDLKMLRERERLSSALGRSTGAEFEIKTLQHWSGDDEDDGHKPGDSTDYPTVDWDGPPMVDNVAISVRRDSDLFGFADPKNFWRAAFENDDSFPDLDGDDPEQPPPVVPALETLNNHVENPTSAQYRDVRESGMNDRVDQVLERRQDAEERRKLYNWFESSTGLALGIAGLTATGPAAALVTTGGLALSVWGWLGSTASALRSESTEAPPYKGVYQPYSYDRDYPAAASFVVFDVYVSPEDAGINPMSKPYFTVRVKHEDDANNSDLDEESIWVVTFDEEIPDGPNDDYDPSAIHNARILPPESAETRLDAESSDDHRISYDEDGEVVSFRPEPTFSIEPGTPTVGDEVTFDPRNTRIGGAPIEKYEWKLWKLSGYKDEPDSNPQCKRQRVSLPDARREANIFESEEEGVRTVEFSQPGRYEMEFTVWDEQDSNEGYTVRKFFDVEPEAGEGLNLSARIVTDSRTVTVGEPVTFEAEVTEEPDVSSIVAASLFADVNELKIYEWDFLQQYERFRPPGDVTPTFDKQTELRDPTFTHTFEEPGQYEVFVKVTDPLSGASGRYSIPVTAVEEQSYELTAEDDPHPFELVTDSITDALTVRLDGPDDADFDLYASLDGRIPTRHDHDRRSRTAGSDEQITFGEAEVGVNPDVKLVVDSYRGKGDYSLTVEDEEGATLEYLGGDGTPQDDDASENAIEPSSGPDVEPDGPEN